MRADRRVRARALGDGSAGSVDPVEDDRVRRVAGRGPQSASHAGLVIGDYRSATSLTGWPVTDATV